MPRLPRITGREAANAFAKAGFTLVRTSGSHHVYAREGSPNITIPIHAGKTIGPGLLRKLVRDAGMTVERFIELLNS